MKETMTTLNTLPRVIHHVSSFNVFIDVNQQGFEKYLQVPEREISTRDSFSASVQSFLNSAGQYQKVKEEVQSIIQSSFNLAHTYAK